MLQKHQPDLMLNSKCNVVPLTSSFSSQFHHSAQKLPSIYSSSDAYKWDQMQRSNINLAVPNSSLGISTERAGVKSSMRNFSKMVCQKLEEVSITTYNEISENLIQEFSFIDSRTDHKNIRRRVYDVLNVLHSMGIIEKDKRQIRWIGYPTEITNNTDKYENEKIAIKRRVQEKKKALQISLQRFVALHRLIQRNKAAEYSQSLNDPSNYSRNSVAPISPSDMLLLPFLLISAPKDCKIDCEMLEDRTQYFFEFNMPFAIHEDMEVLRMLGLDKVTKQELMLIISPTLAKYYPECLFI